MTAEPSTAPVAPAGSLAPDTKVVTATAHQNIVSYLESELSWAESEAVIAWQSKNVAVVAVVAFFIGYVSKLIF